MTITYWFFYRQQHSSTIATVAAALQWTLKALHPNKWKSHFFVCQMVTPLLECHSGHIIIKIITNNLWSLRHIKQSIENLKPIPTCMARLLHSCCHFNTKSSLPWYPVNQIRHKSDELPRCKYLFVFGIHGRHLGLRSENEWDSRSALILWYLKNKWGK